MQKNATTWKSNEHVAYKHLLGFAKFNFILEIYSSLPLMFIECQVNVLFFGDSLHEWGGRADKQIIKHGLFYTISILWTDSLHLQMVFWIIQLFMFVHCSLLSVFCSRVV